jgi:hypothetical protein
MAGAFSIAPSLAYNFNGLRVMRFFAGGRSAAES